MVVYGFGGAEPSYLPGLHGELTRPAQSGRSVYVSYREPPE
jgi:hypothetical protein